eukprot:scaffold2858_cov659-Pavlova_lutheri.AAC.128
MTRRGIRGAKGTILCAEGRHACGACRERVLPLHGMSTPWGVPSGPVLHGRWIRHVPAEEASLRGGEGGGQLSSCVRSGEIGFAPDSPRERERGTGRGEGTTRRPGDLGGSTSREDRGRGEGI